MATPCGGSAGCAPAPAWSAPPGTTGRAAVNNKVMVVAVAVLFVVVLFIFALHLYAKWFWRNQGTATIVASDGTIHTLSWRRGRYRGDPRIQNPTATTTVPQSVGLAREVVEALPLFEYSGGENKLECAVCLEDFEDGEKGRSLPKCGHNFHLECIDMWLHSHSTCPLCRTNVAGDGETKQTVVQIQAQEEAPTIGDVRGPFLAAMRASRRRQRSLTSPTELNSLPRTAENHHDDADNQQQSESEIPPPETTSHQSLKDHGTPSVSESRSASGIRAPFQITIDIPRSGASVVSSNNNNSNPANAMSPMARASASFRRLLSRGKNVVTPQSDDDSPSSSLRPSSPPPPPPPPPSV